MADIPAAVSDTPPRRVRDSFDAIRIVMSALLIAVVLIASVYMRGLSSGVEHDVHQVSSLVAWLGDVPSLLITQTATLVILCSVIIQIILNREWLQVISSLLALIVGYEAVWILSAALSAWGSQALISALWSVTSAGRGGLLPDMYAAAAAFLTAAGPKKLRSTVRWGWNLLFAVAIILVAFSTNSLGGVLVSLATGRIVGLVTKLAIGVQNKGAWGSAVVDALTAVGLDVRTLTRRESSDGDPNTPAADLADDLTQASRLYDVEDHDGRTYIVSVLDAQAYASGYLAQLWQWIKFSGISVRRDRSVADSVRHHQAMLLALRNTGLPAMRPYAVAEQGESAMLVLDAATALRPLGDATPDDADLAGYVRYMDAAQRRGLAHHAITPKTLAFDGDGRPVIAGWQTGDAASSQANIAIDRIQLLTVLASLSDVRRTIAAARTVWSDDELAKLVPFVQRVAIPSATRTNPLFTNGVLNELRDELRALVDEEATASMPQVTLTRFSLRSFVAIALLVVALLVIVTQLNMEQVIEAVRGANLRMAALSFAFGIMTWMGSGITLGSFIDRNKRNYMGLVMSQAASSFTAVSMPAGVGPAFVNLQFLRRSGYTNSMATAIMSAVLVLQFLATFLLIVLIGLFTGSNTFSGVIPTNTLIMVISTVVMAAGVTMAIPPIRRLIRARLVPVIVTYARQLATLMTRPRQLLAGALGALIQTFSFGLAFWAALMAFGWRSNVFETTFVFLLANTLGSAIPTPGGLGAVEAALMAAFSATGVPSAVALSATLVYRLVTYWLRIPLGALAMKWLDRHHLI